ncbi:hypothetical protein AB0I81_54065 [Nonomuraea sp. NPDC050404]|uniref:hypothetical protein n=1 Tax=Nonomuraea sp. NPDC050404 TaxID=3155783 RepID=UPI0033E722FF
MGARAQSNLLSARSRHALAAARRRLVRDLRQAPRSGAFRVISEASVELDDQDRTHYLTGTADTT